MSSDNSKLLPKHGVLGRWMWPDPDSECVRLLRRTGRFRILLTAWLEEQITAMVDLSPEVLKMFDTPEAARQERLRLFREAAFTLHVEEHFSRSKRNRDRIIYSMLRCRSRPRVEELAIAIREGDFEFATAAIRFSEGPESAQGGRIGPIFPDSLHPELNRRLNQASEGDLIGPFVVDDFSILLRLDQRITTRLDEKLQDQILKELYDGWLDRQLKALEVGDSIEPPEYIPSL